MQVFKAYFKIIRKNIGSMMIYVAIFLVFAVIMTLYTFPQASTIFTATKIRIAVVQEDANNSFSQDLAKYLAESASVQAVATDPESLQDALFFRQVEYIVRIPAGFGDSFMKGDYAIDLIKSTVPDTTGGVQMDLIIDRYLNTAALYVDSVPDIAALDLASHVRTDLAAKAAVTVQTSSAGTPVNRTTIFFTYMAYTIMAVMILGVTTIMLAFNNRDIQKRNFSSPVKMLSFNAQLILGNLVFAVITWGIMVCLALITTASSSGDAPIGLLALNALVFTLASLSISFLISNFIKSRNVQQAIANVFTLGSCFISGVFVPQFLLNDTVLRIASFTPTYWYVSNVTEIGTGGSAQLIGTQMLIQVGFAVAALAVSLVVAKQRRQGQTS